MSESELTSYHNLAIEAAVWLVSIVGCAVALILSRRAPPKCLGLSLVLALFALTVGYLGLWTPFSFVPRIGYSWTDGDYRLYIDINRFFIAPLVLGSFALLLAVRVYWKSSRAAMLAGSMEIMKDREDAFGAVSIAMLLLITAWGSAWAMVIASAIGLAAGLIWFRTGRIRGALIIATAVCVMAVAIALAVRLGRGQ